MLVQHAVTVQRGRRVAGVHEKVAVNPDRDQPGEVVAGRTGAQTGSREMAKVGQMGGGGHLAETSVQRGCGLRPETGPARRVVVADAGQLCVVEGDVHQQPQNPLAYTYWLHATLWIKKSLLNLLGAFFFGSNNAFPQVNGICIPVMRRHMTAKRSTSSSSGGSKRGRSAITGRFVKQSTVRRNPATTVNEQASAKAKKK